MQKTSHIITVINSESKSKLGSVLDYSDILQHYGAIYAPAEYYWQVGELKEKGWILDISAIRSQIPEILNLVVPEFMSHSLTFKIIRDYYIAGNILNGNLGYIHLGKMLSIYFANDQQALYWAKKLISLTKHFRGPIIHTDLHLGSIIYARHGSLDTIPFMLPPNFIWPFQEIASPLPSKNSKLLNYAYYPLAALKIDAKGDVIKGIYFKNFWRIKPCLIKQGRLNMLADDAGRDIQDRLQWQFDLYQKLAGDIPMPKIFDYFRQGVDSYLVMEFIKALSLTKWIDIAYQYRNWQDLPLLAKWQLLDTLIQIIKIVERLHERGYIHRDITPENFLIDKTGKLYLIDMELTWCCLSSQPDPPFRMGTPGFMSPEQCQILTPTDKEDIYGIGALMVVFFTNLSPMKFHASPHGQLREQLFFFTKAEEISNLIADCLQTDPALRPKLKFVESELKKFRQSLQYERPTGNSFTKSPEVLKKSVTDDIQAGIRGLSIPKLLSPKHRWISGKEKKENYIENEQLNLALYEGWYTGMAGPLWLVARAKMAGFCIDACLTAYSSSWEYIQDHYFRNYDSLPKGLYTGSAGISLAIVEGLKSGLLLSDSVTNEHLRQCFYSSTYQLDLFTGYAGQGIALLQCTDWIEDTFLQARLKNCIENVLNSQKTDGSWDIPDNSRKRNDILLGLDHGIAGIVWFLLAYIEFYPSIEAEKAARMALSYLIRKAEKKKQGYMGTISTSDKSIDEWNIGQGIPGILLVFIKAYECLKDPIYLKIVESGIRNIRPRPILADLTLGSGLAGLGEFYLETFRILKSPVYKERADWIAEIFVNCFNEVEQGIGYWRAQPIDLVTADLFSGNSGILHFLIRYVQPEKMSHPLSPSKGGSLINNGIF